VFHFGGPRSILQHSRRAGRRRGEGGGLLRCANDGHTRRPAASVNSLSRRVFGLALRHRFCFPGTSTLLHRQCTPLACPVDGRSGPSRSVSDQRQQPERAPGLGTSSVRLVGPAPRGRRDGLLVTRLQAADALRMSHGGAGAIGQPPVHVLRPQKRRSHQPPTAAASRQPQPPTAAASRQPQPPAANRTLTRSGQLLLTPAVRRMSHGGAGAIGQPPMHVLRPQKQRATAPYPASAMRHRFIERAAHTRCDGADAAQGLALDSFLTPAARRTARF